MKRAALEIVLTLVLAIALLGAFYSLVTGSPAGFGDAIHHLFLFMDVGIGLWILLLAITVSLRRPASARLSILFALIGVLANFAAVTIVGLVQSGGAPEFMRWAAEAGAAFVLASATVAPLLRRVGGAERRAKRAP